MVSPSLFDDVKGRGQYSIMFSWGCKFGGMTHSPINQILKL